MASVTPPILQGVRVADGYPVISRCYRNGAMTLDLTLQSVSRKPIPEEAFALPDGDRRIDPAAMTGRAGR